MVSAPQHSFDRVKGGLCFCSHSINLGPPLIHAGERLLRFNVHFVEFRPHPSDFFRRWFNLGVGGQCAVQWVRLLCQYTNLSRLFEQGQLQHLVGMRYWLKAHLSLDILR